MSDSDDVKGLQERLNKARQDLQDSLERQAGMERTNGLLTLGIVILVVGFMFAGWHRLKINFAPDQVQHSLVTQGPEMASQVLEAVMETASEVLPVYYQEVQTRSIDALPELAMALDKEVNELGTSASEKVMGQLENALNQVHATQEDALRKTYPDLTEEQAKEFANNVMGTVEEELEGLSGYILAKTVGDIDQLDKTLKAFNTKDLPDDEAELSRLMLHHFLQVLDAELMEMPLETPKTEDTAATKGGRK
jgi:hypothetical protein